MMVHTKILSSFVLILLSLFLLQSSGNCQVSYSKSAAIENSEKKSIQTIKRIFKNYTQYNESTDSPENKEAMKNALTSLHLITNGKYLPLLIDVWMYYDPTDFGTRELIMPVLNKNKKATLIAIRNRLKQIKKWESNDKAPYSDLILLENDLTISNKK